MGLASDGLRQAGVGLAPGAGAADQADYSGQRSGNLAALASRLQATRFGAFSIIGACVFVAGTALQGGLIALGQGQVASYIWQAIFSIELSFVLNRLLTWGDRHVDLPTAVVRWNVQKIAITVPNVLAYDLLVWLGLNWLVANVLLTALFTVVNYAGANLWSFRAAHLARHRAIERPRPSPALAGTLAAGFGVQAPPAVSVVIPVKNSQATIRRTVDSLLAQDYPGPVEVIVVGDIGDKTWQALTDIDDPRLIIVEHEEIPGRLEPAIKRDVGLRKGSGEILALADSDIVMASHWLSTAVRLLSGQGGGVVCGGMRSVDDTFWGRFVDRNSLAAKTPRVPESYWVTVRNFGKYRKKPPVTANAVMSRDVYDECPMDDGWGYGYEDYEWFWRVAKSGRQILFAADLAGAHHHRHGLRALAWEYRVSAKGCAHFIRAHPDSPLARKRRRQAVVLPALAGCALAAALVVALAGFWPELIAVAVASAAFFAIREAARVRDLEALAYPIAGIALGLVFVLDLGRNLIALRPASPGTIAPVGAVQPLQRSASAGSVPGPVQVRQEQPQEQPRASARGRGWLAVAFLAVLAAGAAVRFWQLATKPEWQFDEAIYWNISHNIQTLGTLNEHITYGSPWAPFLYQPPVYLIGLARWFALTGPTIYHARVLGVCCSIISLALVWRLIARLQGPRAALVASIPIVFDGWLLFIQRVSYIENATLLLVVAAVLLYQRALDGGQLRRFVLAGVVIGIAICVKYTAVYLVPTVILCWLITRGRVRPHLALLGSAAALLLAEQITLTMLFDPPGHRWFIDQSLTQAGRVLGVGAAGGTLGSPGQLVHLISAQYKVFLPSLAIALGGLGFAVVMLVRCYRQRTMEQVRPQALLYSWAMASTVIFGGSSLRYPQYFALALVPLYCLWWTELWRLTRHRGRTVVAVSAVVAMLAGLTSFWLRVGTEQASDNVFAAVQQYATAHIPAGAVVLADESVGDLIRQPYCQEQAATPCLWHASYAITWTTYLQSTFKLADPAFRFMMQGAVPVWSRRGFNGTITVWRLST